MDRNEILERFHISQIGNGIEKLRELDQFCWSNRDRIKEKLEAVLKKLACTITAAQRQKIKDDIFCISLCFSRSKFVMREGTVRIYGFDKRFYLDSDPIWADMDFGNLCAFIWDLEDRMIKALPLYRNKLTQSDVQMIIQTEYVPLLVGYIVELVRYAVRKGGAGCFDDILVTDNFSIMAGEYKGSFDQVFVTEKLDTGGKSLREFFSRHDPSEMSLSCKRYINETLSKIDLGRMDFTGSRFEQMDVCESSLEGSSLLKTDWLNCRLRNNSWKEAFLFGATFSGSDLTGSDFSGITAPVFPPNIVFPATLSWSGLDFAGANLSHVKFRGADVRGANFREAMFCQTDFTDALVDKAVFTLSGCIKAELTGEQRRLVKIEG